VPDPANLSSAAQLEINTTNPLYAEVALTALYGGHFAEYGSPIDTTGAGQLTEQLTINGNIPPPY
jgi:hypothetical protein